jgi:hypothetical protein
METEQGAADITGERWFSRRVIPLLWLMVFLSVLFAALIFVIPLDGFRLLGHIFEATVALFCMACCLYLYRSVSDRLLLLLAAFAFFSYALSTTFWYLYTMALGRMFVFTTVAEFGFLCFFFFFIAAISIEFPDRGMRSSTIVLLLLIFLAVPVVTGFVAGDRQPIHFVLITVRFLVIGLLVTTAIRHGVHHYTLLWAGICLRCLASMLYGIRETLFVVYPVPLFPPTAFTAPLTVYDFLSVVGPMIICSYALILIGLFSYITGSRDPAASG